jgi:hypothetical protein
MQLKKYLILPAFSTMKIDKRYLVFFLLTLHGIVSAQPSGGTMSEPAKAAQKMQNRLFPQVQIPLSYNYNQNMGANNAVQQAELSLSPIIPVNITSQVQLILNPMLTYNRNLNDQQLTNQNQPLQLATFLAPTYAKEWYFGIGPYFQAPATNANNGSRQTGVGVSAGAFYTPANWVIGGAMFNSWGIGSDLSGGTADVLNLQPTISYTTDNAWTYNLSSQLTYSYTARNATNQLTLSGGKTVQFSGYHLQLQIGPTYMVTTTPTSAKGIGAFVGLTALLPR